jgi:biopolymer transport protein ExbD/biopolymer transport protein TolR
VAISLGVGGKKRIVEPAMNVTPLVDVVLVLLIIFMVVTPLLSKDFWVHLPKQEKEEIQPEQLPDDPVPPLVLRVGPDRSLQVNGAVIGFEELSDRLKRMFAARDDHILFFDADDDVDYGFAVEVLDQARDGGAVTIAPLVERLTQSNDAASPADAAPGIAAPEATPPDATAPAAP